LSWFWNRVKDRDLVSVFYTWISSFPSSICWRGCLFSTVCFGLFCWKSVDYRCMGLCLDLLFWSIGLPVCFRANTMLFLLLWICSIVWSRVLWCLQHWIFCSELLWLFGVFCVFICISQLFFLMSLEFWQGLHWTCRLLLVVWPFSQYWFYQSTSMEGLSIFCCLLWFLSSVVYSFH
jgi:hypothetical protein